MFGATKRWFRRNRKGLAIGAGLLTAGYMAGQYLLSKLSEARERMSSDRIAKENLRRRFEQNQTDCTYTVLALLPTAAEDILEALPVEELTQELQRKRTERLAKANAGDATSSELSSASPSAVGDDQQSSLSSSGRTDNFLHTSQLADSSSSPSVEPEHNNTNNNNDNNDDNKNNNNNNTKPKVKRSKAQLWKEVKITSITRSFTLVYTLSLLTIFTRTQLNLLGRRNYLSSVISLATPPANQSTISLEDHDDDLTQTLGNDLETNRRYLAFSWWLLHRGWKELMEQVRDAVTDVFGPLNPREDVTLAKLSGLTLQIRKRIEGNTERDRNSKKWLSYLLPPLNEEDKVLQESGVLGVSEPSSPQTVSKLRHLLDETADLIESPSFAHVVTLLNNEGFSTLIEKKCATDAFKPSSGNQANEVPQSFESIATVIPPPESEDPRTKLANILAVMARQAHVIGNGANPPNEYLEAMDQGVRELDAFAAVVYSSNFDSELLSSSGVDSDKSPQAESTTGIVDPSSSYATVLVDNKNDDLHESREEEGKFGNVETGVVAAGEDSAFEQVWGKAVEGNDDNPSNASGG